MRRSLLALLFAGIPAVASAHPLGNFTVNRYAALRVEPRAIALRYVVDMAEIPAFQETGRIDTDADGAIDDPERAAYLGRAGAELAPNLVLTLDGRPLALAPGARSLELPPGAGGLPTLRLEMDFTAPLPGGARGVVELRDRNFPGRPGWQEMVADAGAGAALEGSTVPRTDRSRALRAYPADLLASPPQVTAARFTIVPGGAGAAAGTGAETVEAAARGDRLTALIATREPLRPGLVVVSLLLAAALGALHALGPGHGKTVVAAYLVGARGTARHALFLGLVVTATHTLGVYLLGLVTLTASHWIVPERLFPWLSAVSGLLVVGIGASLAVSRLAAAGGHEHHHDHDHHHPGHAHDHAHHGHAHGGGHGHALPSGPLGWRSLLALGVSGGLLPCPSALVVMLGAVALGRIAFGLLLIVAFSAGLAAVLTGIGLVLVYARGLLERLPDGGRLGRLARLVPVASAVVISVAGLAIVAQALVEIGARIGAQT
jgi:ABC-type nickel/cobalt efflux system permease component RcnA